MVPWSGRMWWWELHKMASQDTTERNRPVTTRLSLQARQICSQNATHHAYQDLTPHAHKGPFQDGRWSDLRSQPSDPTESGQVRRSILSPFLLEAEACSRSWPIKHYLAAPSSPPCRRPMLPASQNIPVWAANALAVSQSTTSLSPRRATSHSNFWLHHFLHPARGASYRRLDAAKR